MTRYDALTELLDERYSCRQFLPKQVSREVLEQLLSAARRTPSWSNTQSWQIIVTEGDATRKFSDALVEHVASGVPQPDFPFPANYNAVHRARRRECGGALYESIGVVKSDTEATTRQFIRNYELFDAPHAAIITTDADLGVYGAVDCGLFLQTFLLAAQSLGLAAIAQAALAAYSPFLHEWFDIPDTRKVVAGISFGYPDETHPINGFRTSRAPLDEIVRFVSD
ncbi:nitroreductase [Rhodococcus sp. IEGM 1370]|uniref:nitroreductase n=1 Tax=unclassified Rhodococcus (in: high G+C Gram-positive bacteria) TaxID=192944 RepID=UPI0011EBF8AD|nr:MULTISPECIES: nitroreductase [unclassified Rhodococcus (in: high G+C Gram-positive bacteria)]KAA0925819.1 nitroreductase [Rhodococcus sp. ANT_H53B]MDV8076420.1 nitroreductase [Rhodococcus sp. IEGM 1370]